MKLSAVAYAMLSGDKPSCHQLTLISYGGSSAWRRCVIRRSSSRRLPRGHDPDGAGERNPVANRAAGAPGAEVGRRGGANRVALILEHAARRACRENGRDRFVDAAAEGDVEFNVAGFDGDVGES